MLDHIGRAIGLRDRNGSHSGCLHSNGMGYLLGNDLVETDKRTELLVEVYVRMTVGSFDTGIVCQLDLLAGLTRFLGHHLLDSAAFGILGCQQRIAVRSIGFHGNVQHRVS